MADVYSCLFQQADDFDARAAISILVFLLDKSILAPNLASASTCVAYHHMHCCMHREVPNFISLSPYKATIRF